MKKVSFTEMKNGTKDDYQLLEKLESQYERKTADRIKTEVKNRVNFSDENILTALCVIVLGKFVHFT